MKLTIYNKGKHIDRLKDTFFVCYSDTNNKEIINQKQIDFLQNYFSKHNYNHNTKISAIIELNKFSAQYNKKLLTK